MTNSLAVTISGLLAGTGALAAGVALAVRCWPRRPRTQVVVIEPRGVRADNAPTAILPRIPAEPAPPTQPAWDAPTQFSPWPQYSNATHIPPQGGTR